MQGRTIRIYLIDGTPQGLLTAEIINWTGKVLVLPRSQLAQLAQRPEAGRTGVYVLLGPDPDHPLQERVYIGESDNVLTRLIRHNSDASKEFWDRTVFITGTDENLTKAHVRYLESRLIKMVQTAKRALLANGTAPDPPALPESDRGDMETFLEQIQILLPALGFNFALPVPTLAASQATGSQPSLLGGPSALAPAPAAPIFETTLGGAHAEARELGGEFVVLKGSQVRKATAPSIGATYQELREQFRKDGKLIDGPTPDLWVFNEDVPFSSPSTAARIIGGSSYNGRVSWKIKGTSQTYKDWQEAQIAQASNLAASGVDPGTSADPLMPTSIEQEEDE